MNEFNHEYKGIKFNINRLSAPQDANGRKLYQIEIEDWGKYNVRQYFDDMAIKEAKSIINEQLD